MCQLNPKNRAIIHPDKSQRLIISPIPHCIAKADKNIIDIDLMEKVDGVLVKDKIPVEWAFTKGDHRLFSQVIFDKLIELHQVDIEAAGLTEFGTPEGYAARQIVGWNKRFVNAKTADIPGFDDVREWLVATIPDESNSTLPASLLHGDYRIDNVMLDPKDPFKVVAVLDWEMAALGDPLMDLSNALAYWVHNDDPIVLKSILKQPSDMPGMMRREEIIAHYGDRTGLDTSRWDFYEVYGYWRLVVILQQLYFRYVNKQTQDVRFASYGQAVSDLDLKVYHNSLIVLFAWSDAPLHLVVPIPTRVPMFFGA